MRIDLPAIASRYCEEHILASDYAKTLLRTAENCQRFSSVNQYLQHRMTQVKAITVRNDRAMLLILLRWAYDQRMTDEYPRGIASVRVRREPTRAWTLEQTCTAVKYASQLRGKRLRSGADRGEFLECWLRLGYATGARYGDLMKLNSKHFSGNRLYYAQNKTGNPISCVLPDAVMQSVQAMLRRSPDGRVLGWACGKRWAMRMMRKLLDSCGLDGSSKWLRRSSATHVEIKRKGAAKVFLGHLTPGLADRCYVDWAQVGVDSPSPPELVLIE